jgi:hypothetical protein
MLHSSIYQKRNKYFRTDRRNGEIKFVHLPWSPSEFVGAWESMVVTVVWAGRSIWLVIFGFCFFASLLVALSCCLVGLGPGVWCAAVLGLVAGSASTHSYKHDRRTRMKYPWVIGFGLLLPKPIPIYPMGGDFVPYPYPWGQFSSHTRTLIGEFPTSWRVSSPHWHL